MGIKEMREYYTTTKVAKEMGWSRETMNKFLLKNKIQFKSKFGYFIAAKHAYILGKPFYVTVKQKNGKTKVLQMIYWTKVGKEVIENEINSK